MTLADRIAVVFPAVAVMQYATPDEIYHRPSEFVAGFTGSPAMNFLRGRFSPDADL